MSKPVVLVTGGGKRIGAAISKLLMESGYYVLIHVRNSKDSAHELILSSSQEKDSIDCGDVLVSDLGSEEQLEDLIKTVKNHSMVKESGGLSGLIHNASIYEPIELENLDLDVMRRYFRIHVEAPFVLTKGLLSELKSKSGCVVGIVDTSQGRSWKDLSHYTSSKSALRQLMINLAGDLKPHVRVNCIAPGAILSAEWEVEHFASVLEVVPMGRSGEPIDVAKAVKFLMESPHISGQIINVDGGWTIVE